MFVYGCGSGFGLYSFFIVGLPSLCLGICPSYIVYICVLGVVFSADVCVCVCVRVCVSWQYYLCVCLTGEAFQCHSVMPFSDAFQCLSVMPFSDAFRCLSVMPFNDAVQCLLVPFGDAFQ